MKRLIALAAMLAVLGIGVGTSFAATDGSTVPPPKVPPILGPEGPDTRLR